jgi:hypothetical protein
MATGKFGLDLDDPNYWRFVTARYRHRLRTGPPRSSADEIKDGATHAELHRVKEGYKGLSRHQSLKELAAVKVDQGFLEEIATLENLEHLDLRYPMRAEDLSPIRSLRKLRVLQIDGASKISDFTPILDLPSLEVLMFEQAQHLFDLRWMRPLKDRLVVLGLEGSTATNQKIASLAPLEGFAFEALFMTSVTLASKDVLPLAACPNLHVFNCGKMAPKANYMALYEKRPDLNCNWFPPNPW